MTPTPSAKSSILSKLKEKYFERLKSNYPKDKIPKDLEDYAGRFVSKWFKGESTAFTFTPEEVVDLALSSADEKRIPLTIIRTPEGLKQEIKMFEEGKKLWEESWKTQLSQKDSQIATLQKSKRDMGYEIRKKNQEIKSLGRFGDKQTDKIIALKEQNKELESKLSKVREILEDIPDSFFGLGEPSIKKIREALDG